MDYKARQWHKGILFLLKAPVELAYLHCRWVICFRPCALVHTSLQFAKASGAKVIATTSSKEKADLLKQLGADEVINYKEFPEWGEVVRGLTPNNEGVTHIVEVAGPATMKEVSSC